MSALGGAVALAVALPLLLVGGGGPPADRADPDPAATSRRLAAEALRVRDDQRGLARHLAVAAYRTAPTPEARDSVYGLFSEDGEPQARLVSPGTSDIEFSPDSPLLATADNDGAVRLWDTTAGGNTNQPLAVLTGNSFWGSGTLTFSPDGTLLAALGANDGSGAGEPVLLWDVTARGTVDQPLATLTGHPGESTTFAFSPDSSLLAVSAGYSDLGEGVVQLWDTSVRGATDRPVATLTSHTDGVSAVAFSPSGRLLATLDYHDSAVRLWDTATRGTTDQPLATLGSHPGGVGGIRFNPDGTLLAIAGGDDAYVQLWETTTRGTTGQPLATFTSDRHGADVRFSPDGTLLAMLSYGGQGRLWDTTTRGTTDQPLATFVGPQNFDGVFSSDSRLIATAGAGGHDESGRLWSTASRGTVKQPLAIFADGGGTGRETTEVAFSPDDGLLATAQDDGTRLWNLDPARMVDRACADPAANQLTREEWDSYFPDLTYHPPCG